MASDMLSEATARGSLWRGGRSCVALGCSAVTASLAAAGTANFTIVIDEECVLDRMVVTASDGGLSGYITGIQLAGDALVSSGYVPAKLFAHDSIASPRFGHTVGSDVKLTVNYYNADGTAVTEVGVGFSVV